MTWPRPSPTILPAALLAAALLASCGGGPAGPAWTAPVTLDEQPAIDLGAMVADETGRAALLWRRTVPVAGGGVAQEVAVARPEADGAWGPVEVLGAPAPSIPGRPAAAVDASGLGWMMWFVEHAGGSTELRGAPLDLGAPFPWPEAQHQYIFPSVGYDRLAVAVGDDGSARAAWNVTPASDVSSVVTARFMAAGAGVWESTSVPGATASAGLSLAGLMGDGRGGYALELYRANDQPVGEGYDYAPGTGAEALVPGWEPASQSGLAAHATAWAADGQGGLEAWLTYVGGSEAGLEAWPRRRDAAGAWTVGDAVPLPHPSEALAVFRGASDAGWLSGSGADGLWVAPLSGVSLGAATLLVAAPSSASDLIGVRDVSGRPALLWVQRRDAAVEGIGFSRLAGAGWTAPALLPGTAGASVRHLRAAAGPGGLVAAWEEPGTGTTRLRAARWR